MHALTISDIDNTYTRISKHVAKLRFFAGQQFYIIGHKIVPGFSFNQALCVLSGKEWIRSAAMYAPDGTLPSPTLWKGTLNETAWQLFYNNWKHSNTSYEQGYYAAYYIAEPRTVATN